MDHKDLPTHSHFLSLNGYCLNLEEKTALQSSLLILQENNHFHTVHFWGKIQGLQNDYLIAEGYRGSMMGERTRFYSVDGGITWNQMTFELTEYEISCIETIRTLFVGIPTHSYVFEKPKESVAKEPEKKPEAQSEQTENSDSKGDEDEQSNEEKEEEESHSEKPKQPVKDETFTITEEKRLTWTVKSIDQDASVVPRGAYVVKKDDDKVIVKNTTFSGLDKYQAAKLYNFVHLRLPVDKTLENIVAQQFIDKNLDFADSIDDDIPYGCWTIQYEELLNVVVVRSLMWPGYVFYHRLQSQVFGGYYIGTGLKNVDLCFMMP
ncbi:hypothetical protein FDP41_000402 [Naegleria fowleri]|uniref:Radial spoke head protein 9 homolog n=1 Tax=Naegleria fowleri TaxID=5763 RepID=A0A6A5C253_NAEFO|nr:uncharacterized protein FDP41_000402 [Naegleria fowleri]KAF0984503.1 hypothetical protein FDP41_000402 [Naegleria fowleri]CAG4712652.1 unnamed protein product [Naegleria fowleri]